MAQITEPLVRAILNGSGYTDNEVRQLAHAWLQHALSSEQAAPDLRKVAEAVQTECEQTARDMTLYTGYDVAERIRAIDIDALIESVKGK